MNYAKKQLKYIRFLSYLLLPAAIMWLEFVLMKKSGLPQDVYDLPGSMLTAFAFGLILDGFCCVLPSKASCWIAFVLAELMTVYFLIQYFCNDAYTAFMSPASIAAGAGGVATEFGSNVISIVKGGVLQILIFEIPALLMLVLNICKAPRFRPSLFLILLFSGLSLLLQSGAACLFTSTDLEKEKYSYDFVFDDGVRTFGVITASELDIKYGIKGTPKMISASQFDPTPVYTLDKTDEDDSAKDAHIGMFEGKDLIMITAESFCKEVLDHPELYPTLCRMAEKGIAVEDFYHPFWGGSTTSGEASILLGIIPTDGANTMQKVTGRENPDTMANRLKEIGYSTIAFHNGTHTYYNRYKTHPALGFDEFIANGTGMEDVLTTTWPGSDKEMFEFADDILVNMSGPYFAYFMTFSGHGTYNFTGNEIDKRYKKEVADLPYSERTRAYFAGNLDFELGLASLVESLEQAGKLDNTVFVITADHYPYALQYGDAWGNKKDYLNEIYGSHKTQTEQDHNALIIWSPCLEEKEPVTVSSPTYSPDILPTMLSLYGIEYDDTVYAGRDILSKDLAIAIWANSSWKTEKGFYSASNGKFTPADGEEAPSQDYIDDIRSLVRDRIARSKAYFD